MNHRMDRNSKEINLAKFNSIIIIRKHVSCNMLFERPFLTKANTLCFWKKVQQRNITVREIILKHLD